MNPNENEFVWSQKYRPNTIEECILPESIKSIFRNILKQGEFQNLLLSGVAGSGKTTAAKALCRELELDYLLINASESGGIDTLRNQIRQFVSTMSITNSAPHKVVILDEFDASTTTFQQALRGFLEEFSSVSRFILTANFKNRIIAPLHSRCTVIDFLVPDFKTKPIMGQMLRRLEDILNNESIEYEKAVLAEIIFKFIPDFRRTINELQRYSVSNNGKIDTGMLVSGSIEVDIRGLAKSLKDKNFKAMREWVVEHGDLDPSMIFRRVYDNMRDLLDTSSIPAAVLILSEYGYRSAFVVDQEINTVACFTEIMLKCKFN